jgi:hypothetical protein
LTCRSYMTNWLMSLISVKNGRMIDTSARRSNVHSSDKPPTRKKKETGFQLTCL